MGEILFVVGHTAVKTGEVLAGAAVLGLVVVAALLIITLRTAKERREQAELEAQRTKEIEERVASLVRIQAETIGGLRSMSESLTGRQAELGRVMEERLDAVTHRVGQSMEQTTRNTTDSLRKLHERLAVIDNAQKNITDLSSQVTSLREILGNKQSRGAFGQGRMEAIVQDGLPKGSFKFQDSLSNRARPDCCIKMPDERPLVIDAKFPLEGVTAHREAKTDGERKAAAQRLRTDVTKHVSDIATKYLIPGETQEMALMFVPSESVYAEIHDNFDDLVQKAFRARVIMVSPSLLMLAIQVVRQIQKDARMREAATLIRDEVGRLMDDVARLGDRVRKLQSHFGQANEDVTQILISADKIAKRGGRIETLELGEEPATTATPEFFPAPPLRKMRAAE